MTRDPPQSNLDVDYVVLYRVDPKDKDGSISQFKQLILTLAEVGLTTEVRTGDETSLLVFIKAADENVLSDVVYRSRMKDWLHGIRQIQPVKDAATALTNDPLTDAERHRQIHHMITGLREDGGASITPKSGQWKNVESVFPLHDHARNKKWLMEFAKKTFLTPHDLDEIKDTVGEKIGFYYAFLQSYFTFMIFPAAFGFSCWVLLGSFSAIYGIVNIVWCLVFVEYWKREEKELSIRWGVKNVSAIQAKRRDFQPEKTIRDNITGEDVPYFPAKKRLYRQLLQIPLGLLCVVGLGTIIITCYSIEIFISEVYNGPFKSVLTFTPVILLTLAVPPMSTFLTSFAERLTSFENYATQEAHDKSMVSKVFVINFLTSYTAIFLTAFVYVPFATILVPYLDIFSLTVKPFAETNAQIQTPTPASFNINPNRLKNQMIYFAVTAQIVNFATETILPLVTQKGTQKYKELQTSRAEKSGGASPSPNDNDTPSEHAFLERVRHEATLPEYDVTTDLREMCIQFGYLSLFSVVWPLTPVSYFINNWIELRGDTFKLTSECRRPNPARADSIGPWLTSLEFLAWLGSITTAALCYMFSGSGTKPDGDGGYGPDGRPHLIKGWALLLCIFFSEHIFMLARLAVRTAFNKLDSANLRKERSERFVVRRKYLEEAGFSDAVKPLNSGTGPGQEVGAERASIDEKKSGTGSGGDVLGNITRTTLEEDARVESLSEGNIDSDARRFWGRQRGWRETEKVGLNLLDAVQWESGGKKEGKKEL